MLQIVPNCSRLFQNVAKCSKMFQIDAICHKILEVANNVPQFATFVTFWNILKHLEHLRTI